MPLDFTSIYKLSDVKQNYIKVSQVAMAPRKRQVKDRVSGEEREEYQYLVPNEVNLGHTVSGKVKKDTESVFEIEDSQRQGNDGHPVLWRFEPLTLDLWNEMGKAGEIGGWDEGKEHFKNDAALIHFYHHEWLLPQLDWWQESSEGNEPPGGSNSEKKTDKAEKPEEPVEPEAAEPETVEPKAPEPESAEPEEAEPEGEAPPAESDAPEPTE